MHEETMRDLIESGSTVVGSLLKEGLIHRQQMERLEKEKELEKEVVEARSRGSGNSEAGQAGADDPVGNIVGEVGTQDEMNDALEDLKAREECSICRTLLEGIQKADRRTQVRALTEYGRFTHAVETGASEDEIRAMLEESETLQAILEGEMGA